MVPNNFVQERGEVKTLPMPWFHGDLKSHQAAEILQQREDGVFLVRKSYKSPGNYTLCLCYEGKVENYRIKYKDDSYFLTEETSFASLHLLVEHYEHDQDGLCHRLTKPLVKLGKLDYHVSKQTFIDQGWIIKKEDLKLGEITGKGQFKDIIKGEYNGEQVAIRALKKTNCTTEQQFLTEAAIMTSLHHPNLTRLNGVVLWVNLFLVTESMGKGALIDYLRSMGTAIEKRQQINFAADICKGMEYLEEKKIVHQDLCADRVMISEDGKAKVADFRLARYYDSNESDRKFRIKWTAPEALNLEPNFTNKSDMWSFGILLWEIYSGGLEPYQGMRKEDVAMQVKGGFRMPPPNGCPSEICDIMCQTWEFDPYWRPTFGDAKIRLTDFQFNIKKFMIGPLY